VQHRPWDNGIEGTEVWTEIVHIVKTVTVRELRNSFSMLEVWLSEGESICIEKRYDGPRLRVFERRHFRGRGVRCGRGRRAWGGETLGRGAVPLSRDWDVPTWRWRRVAMATVHGQVPA